MRQKTLKISAYHPTVRTRVDGRFTAFAGELDRFWSRVDLNRYGCWPWLAQLNRDGYGRFYVQRNGVWCDVLAHRYAYQLLVGEIPAGLTLDHLCVTPGCVRPSHLEPVTASENLKRRHARRRAQNGATP